MESGLSIVLLPFLIHLLRHFGSFFAVAKAVLTSINNIRLSDGVCSFDYTD
jgi:hypothetical protein